jgi:ubiquinone/menaquinone biosynthesis C-methylase UbiE
MLTLPIHKVINQYSKEIGFKFKESKVLDVGCGSGNAVKEMLEFGIETYGVDISFKPGQNLEFLISNGNLQLIKLDNYKIPFQDNYFDIIYADQVLEHVQDLNSFIYPIHLENLSFAVEKTIGFNLDGV